MSAPARLVADDRNGRVVRLTRKPGSQRLRRSTWAQRFDGIDGVDPETSRVRVRDIFNLRGTTDSLQPTGYLPTFLDSLMAKDLLQLEFLYGGGPNEFHRPMPTFSPPKDTSHTKARIISRRNAAQTSQG